MLMLRPVLASALVVVVLRIVLVLAVPVREVVLVLGPASGGVASTAAAARRGLDLAVVAVTER